MIITLVIILLLALILLRVPIVFAILGSATVGLLATGGPATLFGVFKTIPISSTNSYTLAAIPLFIFMAHLVLASGAMSSVFESARVLVGRIKGGTGIAAVLAGAGFAAVSGSSTAASATLAHTTIGDMKQQGYSPKLASGAVASAGTLAAMIPPSILLVFYAITAEISVGKTLLAGLVPGVLMAIALCITVFVLALRGHAPAAKATSFAEKARSLIGLLPVVFLFLLVVGAVFFGVTTATEAAAVGALGGFVLMIVYKKVTFERLKEASVGALTTSAMILSLVFAAHVFGHFLTLTGATPTVVETVGGLDLPPLLILFFIICVYLVLGFFMDQMAILALTVPVTLPLIETLGFDPVWFGVLIILAAEIGLVTPPLGLNAFVTSRASGIKIETVFLGSIPFIIAMLVVVVIVFAFPEIALSIPEIMQE
jgi:C4-dicarboxylate transporter DctM subunit